MRKFVRPSSPCEVCPFLKDCSVAGTDHEKYCFIYLLTLKLWGEKNE